MLCPAGSPDALDAAIEGGADAVYLGTTAFNARMNAHNFGGDALRSAVLRAHAYGVKIYVTLNTLVTDRELPAFVEAAKEAYRAGADALIVADLGGAAAIHRAIPGGELHASTQMSGHNLAMAEALSRLGFSRMVVARETAKTDLEELMAHTPIEIEMFVHGALCVCHSGQCLFSSMVGGRSGNRGECAQPCRLPYTAGNTAGILSGKGKGAAKKGADAYPLSLKDLSLATHIPELIALGVSSLKIEGRMKSPEYVRDTTRIFRRLLDESRAASPEEMRELADIFSRGGFTDAYFTEKIGHDMLGVRTETDKSNSRAREPFGGLTRKIPLNLHAKVVAEEPCSLTLSDGTRSVTVTGDIPQPARTAPLTREAAEKNLNRFGGTPYCANVFRLELSEGLMLPLSRLNDLRRRAVAAWENEKTTSPIPEMLPWEPQAPTGVRKQSNSARFYRPEQISPEARSFFDRIFLPLQVFTPDADGVLLPPVIFDHERESIVRLLQRAKERGATMALVGNIGHIELAREAGLTPLGDYRLNITNRESMRRVEELGCPGAILSPELTLPQARDIGGDTALIVYGRIPLMTLEKCVSREISDCKACSADHARLRDRMGAEFPVLREWEHRNVIYNSVPTSMSDRQERLIQARILSRHFLFSTESPEEINRILRAWRSGAPLPGNVRRIL